MNTLKYELQNIIKGNGPIGVENFIKTTQNHLRGNEISSQKLEKHKHFKSEEESELIQFIEENNLFYSPEIIPENYISEGAEQKVYRFDGEFVIKLNDSIFYESWLDYFNNLLIHNYFFESTQYQLLGFKVINQKLFAVVKQKFIVATEEVNLNLVKKHLEFNGFKNIRNNDYLNEDLGLIFEDLHDENIISNNGILYFINTIFYLTNHFYQS